MSTLAQHLYEMPAELYPDDPDGQVVWGMLRDSIGYPGYNKDPKDLAERFVFDNSLYELSTSLREDYNIDGKFIMKTIHVPSNPMWMEWRDENGRVGALVAEADDRTYIIGALDAGYNGRLGFQIGGPYILCHIQKLPSEDDMVRISVDWIIDTYKCDKPVINRLMRYCVLEVITALFMLCVPKVSETVLVGHGPRLQKARKRRGKVPLIEYKKVKVHLQLPSKRHIYDNRRTTPSDPQRKHRLHKVLGHFRTYEKDREKPLVTFVPQYWRGDPELGIVLHERRIDK